MQPGTRDLCLNIFDGDQAQAEQILETLGTVPFLGERRVVYVRRFDHMSTSDQELIARACQKGLAGAVLVLTADSLDRRKSVTKLLLQAVAVVETTPPEGDALVKWLMDEARGRGIQLEREAAVLMSGQSGQSADALVPELEKLVAYVGEGSVATAEDVAAVQAAAAPWAAENEIFQLCDATAQGQLPAALTSIDRLIGTGAHPIYIVTMLARHYRRLLAVKSFGGRDAVQAGKDLGLRSPKFAVERLMRQAARLSQEAIEDGLYELLQADLSLKRGAEPRTTLERVTVALATKGRRALR